VNRTAPVDGAPCRFIPRLKKAAYLLMATSKSQSPSYLRPLSLVRKDFANEAQADFVSIIFPITALDARQNSE